MKCAKIDRLLVLFLLMPVIAGCAAVAIGGAITTAGASIDRRTVGSQIEDQSIELKAYNAFREDRELHQQANISVTSYNLTVLLTGEVPTDMMRQRAAELARNIDKVEYVHNELSIAAPSSVLSRSSDTYITGKVKAKLLAEKKLTGMEIKVVTERGAVYLMGLVTQNEADLATDITRKTGGVQKVVKLFQYID